MTSVIISLQQNRLFADNTSLFPVLNGINLSELSPNSDFKKLSEWVHQWKMSFNPGISKQAQEVIFSRKAFKVSPPAVSFNYIPVARCSTHKHLGMYLDEKLNFGHHITEKNYKSQQNYRCYQKLT